MAGSSGQPCSTIDQLVREGAQRMLAEPLRAEAEECIQRLAGERDECGHRLVVRNGSHQPREVLTSAGAVEVRAPRINDKRVDPDTGQRCRFVSAILPPWARKPRRSLRCCRRSTRMGSRPSSIESTFVTVRHRTKVTKSPGSRVAGLAMAYKLIEAAQARWRAVNAPHLVALLRTGAVFRNGKLVERPDGQPLTKQAG